MHMYIHFITADDCALVDFYSPDWRQVARRLNVISGEIAKDANPFNTAFLVLSIEDEYNLALFKCHCTSFSNHTFLISRLSLSPDGKV